MIPSWQKRFGLCHYCDTRIVSWVKTIAGIRPISVRSVVRIHLAGQKKSVGGVLTLNNNVSETIVYDTHFKYLKTNKFMNNKGLQESHPLGSIPRLSRKPSK